MALTQIIHLGAKSPLLDQATKQARTALKGPSPRHFVIGTHVQDTATVQVTSEWQTSMNPVELGTTTEYHSFIDGVHRSLGELQTIFHVALNRSAFVGNGPVTAKVVEFVQIWFPVSRVTPGFKQQVEVDFSRFDEIYVKGVKEARDCAFGWVLEEQEHENITGEKAKCFFVTRGWESMEQFERGVKNDTYDEAIPILLAWNAPFKMWHVERKVLDGVEVSA